MILNYKLLNQTQGKLQPTSNYVGIEKEQIKEIFMGQVAQAGSKQNPARQVAILAGSLY